MNCPVPALLDLYRRIHVERMAGVPFLNEALSVDVLQFQERRGRWSGILITPWFINLVLFPAQGEEWGALPAGTPTRWSAAGRTLECVVDQEPAVGPYQMCTLMAPVTQFADQASARAMALALWDGLLDAGITPEGAAPADTAAPAAGTPHPSTQSSGRAPTRGRPAENLSRRGFFRRLLGGRDGA